jgi:hypothetical protein
MKNVRIIYSCDSIVIMDNQRLEQVQPYTNNLKTTTRLSSFQSQASVMRVFFFDASILSYGPHSKNNKGSANC